MELTDTLNKPSFFKGFSRIVDLFGKIDEHTYLDTSDSELLHNDWSVVGNDLKHAIDSYEQESSCQRNWSRIKRWC